MKLLIASDIHGSALYCARLLSAFEREGADRLVLLGDILYHGPRNDLPEGYAPKEVARMLNSISDRILCVRGNCDAEVDRMVLDFPVSADCAMLFFEGLVCCATHGHLAPLPLPKGDILLSGHTHIPAWNALPAGTLSLNPGSISIPKNGTPHSYMTLDKSGFVWKEFDGTPFHAIGLA